MGPFDPGLQMTQVDDLDRRIAGLVRLQKVAWRLLADHATTAQESREARAQLRKSSNYLRALFEMRSERERAIRSGGMEQGAGLLHTPAAA